jgi:hypothetical protein
MTFTKKETLFGIILNMSKPKLGVKTIEFIDPLEIFKPGPEKTQENNETPSSAPTNDPTAPDHSGWIRTPTFEDYFGADSIEFTSQNIYQPLNNATEIASAQELSEKPDDREHGTPPPYYRPRKIIALTPAMVEIVLENRTDNFDGIINGIREYAWQKVRTFKKKESCKSYLDHIYYTLQAFWAHGQSLNNLDVTPSNFLHCDITNLAKISKSEWAIEKTKSITDSLAVADGKLKATWRSESDSYSQGGSDCDNDSERKATSGGEKMRKLHNTVVQSNVHLKYFLLSICM